MKSYPLELRQRIVGAVDQQHDTIEEIAEQFGVTERYVYKLLRLRHDTADLAPLPHGGGARAKLTEEKLPKLAELVAEFPDATLAQLRDLLRRRCRLSVCANTIWRGLREIDLTLKKRPDAHAKPARRSGRPLAGSK